MEEWKEETPEPTEKYITTLKDQEQGDYSIVDMEYYGNMILNKQFQNLFLQINKNTSLIYYIFTNIDIEMVISKVLDNTNSDNYQIKIVIDLLLQLQTLEEPLDYLLLILLSNVTHFNYDLPLLICILKCTMKYSMPLPKSLISFIDDKSKKPYEFIEYICELCKYNFGHMVIDSINHIINDIPWKCYAIPPTARLEMCYMFDNISYFPNERIRYTSMLDTLLYVGNDYIEGTTKFKYMYCQIAFVLMDSISKLARYAEHRDIKRFLDLASDISIIIPNGDENETDLISYFPYLIEECKNELDCLVYKTNNSGKHVITIVLDEEEEEEYNDEENENNDDDKEHDIKYDFDDDHEEVYEEDYDFYFDEEDLFEDIKNGLIIFDDENDLYENFEY